MNKILVCTGFHRSATSATANYLVKSGLPMGKQLMGSNISNKGGHFEDLNVVKLHDSWLANNNTSWQYHDEIDLSTIDLTGLVDYVALRDSQGESWGVKDPRASLFLTQWKEVIGERGCYLFVLRHWASSIESLLHRHSRELAHQLVSDIDSPHFKFWKSPTLAARMWLAYCRRILVFVKQNKKACLLVTQRGLFEGCPLIRELNNRFGLGLEESSVATFKTEWLRDEANHSILDMLPASLVTQLEIVWNELLDLTRFKSKNERPYWKQEKSNLDQYYNQFLDTLSFRTLQKKLPKIIDANRLGVKKFEEIHFFDVLLNIEKSDEAVSLLEGDSIKYLDVNTETVNSVIELIEQRFSFDLSVNVALARWLQRIHFWSDALMIWQKCLSLGKVYPYMYFNISQCYQHLGQIDLMNSFIDQAIDANPNNASFWLFKATSLQENGSIDEALYCYGKAITITPERPAIVLPYCQILAYKGKVDEAFETISNLYEKIPDNRGVNNMRISLAFMLDTNLGERLYNDKLNSFLSLENKQAWLSNTLSFVGDKASEIDLLTRVFGHWDKVKTNRDSQNNS